MDAIADKQSLKEWIDQLEDQAMLKNLSLLKRSTEGTDFWNDLPEEAHRAINQAKAEAKEAKGIPHEQVMKEMNERFSQ
ncbi:MAG TPA: hypothetical protein VK112_02040 [Fodinibius sp.]|nr:hypothetical protein [Fodinibius sp.]